MERRAARAWHARSERLNSRDSKLVACFNLRIGVISNHEDFFFLAQVGSPPRSARRFLALADAVRLFDRVYANGGDIGANV